MAEDFLESIYQKAKMLTELRVIVKTLRWGQVYEPIQQLNQLLPSLEELCEQYQYIDYEKAVTLRKGLEESTQYGGDALRLGDCIETRVIPYCEEYLRHTNRICVDDEQGYSLESSESGFLTIRDTESGRYLHSRLDPMWEARILAEKIYDPSKRGYSLLGGGLGYLAYQLWRLSDGAVKITLFEYEERMAQYARRYGVLDWIPGECLEVRVDPDILPFLYSVEDEFVGYHIFEPEMHIAPRDTWSVLQELMMINNTVWFYDIDVNRNYYKNIYSAARPVSELDVGMMKKKVIVVAGGPSLDDSLDFIRENQSDMSVIAVGTVFRKLVASGIQPDMVTILDPKKVMLRQLEGVEDQQIPLLLGITAYWKLADRYTGPKYLVPTLSALDREQEYAEQYGLEVWNCGCTVTMMAVNAALYCGAAEIYLAGADFAYPGGWSHASGTNERQQERQEDLFPVEAVDGGVVYSRADLTMFRRDLEGLIASTPDVTYYNMSGSGAKIAGTRQMREDDQEKRNG